MKHFAGLIIICAMLCGEAHAQSRFSLGLEGGYTRSYLITNISNLSYTEYQPKGGYSFSIPIEYKLKEWISLYSDPNYTQKNYQYTRTGSFQGVYENYSNSYIQLPLMGRVQARWRKLTAFINTGLYVGYWASGNVKGVLPNALDIKSSSGSASTIYDLLNPYSFNEKYSFNSTKDNRIELGWMLGAGLKYQLNNTYQLFAEGRVTNSLTDQQKQYMTHQVPRYNQTYGINIGCMVNIEAFSGNQSK